MSREQLPYMTDEQFDSIAFVYRSQKGCIKVVGMLEAKDYENKPQWEHLATLDSFRWIESFLRSSQRKRMEQIREILK